MPRSRILTHIRQNRAASYGFAAGAVGMLVIGLLANVLYSGQGLGDGPRQIAPVYTQF